MKNNCFTFNSTLNEKENIDLIIIMHFLHRVQNIC